MVAAYLAERCGHPSQVVRTLAQARAALKGRARQEWLAAIVNLELPDAADEEIVALTLSYGVPTVVLTGTFSEAKRRRILRHDIVDYCLKGKRGTEALIRVIERLQHNPSLKVLVVDDMAGSRAQQLSMLAAQQFQVLQANDAEQALAQYREHPELVAVLVALSSENAALDLISELREQASSDDLAIIAVSSAETAHAPAQHLKAGASDFLARPFEKEEYCCRVYACVDRIENMRRIRQLAFTDGLTGVANRLAFFRQVPDLLSDALRERSKPAVALLSIDQLDTLNERHGHQVGDQVLRQVATAISNNLGPGMLIARFSGQQFAVFVRNATPAALTKLFERLRASVERAGFELEDHKLPVTLSCGVVSCEADDPLDLYVNRADDALEAAEDAGGNRVALRA
ncbi:MAG: diguanylate cyclase [Polyangiales bacterium]